VAAVKFREPFSRCLRRQWILMFQATQAVSRGGPAYRTGQLRGLAQEKQSWYKAGRTTKYSTRLSVNYTSRTHTQTYIQTHSGLRNGPN